MQVLLGRTIDALKQLYKDQPQLFIGKKGGTDFEKIVYDTLKAQAMGTEFDGTIELIGGQKFPDIVVDKKYGIEVKSSKGAGWRTTGSSIAEGTRVEGVDEIYLLFVKLSKPVDFRYRLYQDCLSEAVVTHSPRYQVDMELKEGETLFDKIGIQYNELRQRDNPIQTVLNYYRQNMRPGESTWWISEEQDKASNFVLRTWDTLDKPEQHTLHLKAFCLFPEIFGQEKTKYNRFTLWLVSHNSVVNPHARDVFSAGGTQEVEYLGKVYSLPRICYQVYTMVAEIQETLKTMELEELAEFDCPYKGEADRWERWVEAVCSHAKKPGGFPLKNFLLNA
ncbi:MAG: hypothetical protein CSA97_02880 [Bacteroidetes bacterium]|nr:MAG: hypothetical protein CSA97_02880 [Bacteroidota bacterium]